MPNKTTFYRFHFTVKIDLVDEAYYFKQVFHFLYDKSVTPAEELFYFLKIL